MKNWKIGKKLLVGFGIPIVMMVAIVILVVTLNLSTITNIKSISVQTDIWDMAVDARGEFMNARVQSAQLIYGYQDSLHDNTITYLDSVEKAIDEAQSYVNANSDTLGDLVEEVETAVTEIDNYRASFEEMSSALKESDTAKADTISSGALLQEEMDAVSDGQIQSLFNDFENFANAATPTAANSIRDERDEKLTETFDLEAALTSLRVTITRNLETFDQANSEEAITAIDNFVTTLETYRSHLNVAANIAACDTLIATMSDYKANFQHYINVNIDALNAQTQFRTDGDDTTAALNIIADQNADVNAASDESTRMATIALIAVTALVLLAIIVSLFMAVTITKGISGPVGYVTKILKAIGTRGRTNFTEEEWAEQRKLAAGKDETAECATYLGNVAAALNGVAGLLAQVADGDLTIEHTAMSEDDVISAAIIKMIENLNKMFGEIDQASGQVSLGANQISDASQSLAEGSTEQAATVEELSASIQDVSEKTRLNAERAQNASNMSSTVKQNAEKGAAQMSEMTEAVSEINQASQDISKVIKVIDDIAFQTNILALNAAVEAARAGEAGKGFAVVADEVRNLASKSAAAAKETGSLIENSMKKAELGSTIASQTAASLAEIVDGINKSSEIIAGIAVSSEEQSVAISQINEGITQVSEVVQKNSATAEECAASAEELNAQAAILTEHVARFQLKRV